MKQLEKISYWTLFKATFFISMFTFGGGYVIVPLMQKRFGEELGWIDDEEMLDLVAIGQSAPGPIAVNTSILVGYRVLGFRGALVTMVGTVLPPLLIMTILTYVYLAVRDNPYVQHVMVGMQAGIAAIIVNVVWRMASRVIKQGRMIPICVMLGTFVVMLSLDIHILWLLLVAGILGLVDQHLERSSAKEG